MSTYGEAQRRYYLKNKDMLREKNREHNREAVRRYRARNKRKLALKEAQRRAEKRQQKLQELVYNQPEPVLTPKTFLVKTELVSKPKTGYR